MADKTGKTEKPTPRRIRQARKEGQFPRTPDASAWLAVLAGMSLMPYTGYLLLKNFSTELAQLPDIANDPTDFRILEFLGQIPGDIATVAAPMCLAAVAAAVLGHAVQGVHPTTKTLKLKFNRMNPKSGLKRMFGPRALWEMIKSLTKVTIIATVAALVASTLIPTLLVESLPLPAVVDETKHGLQVLVWSVGLAGLALAAADWAYQKRSVMKQLKMTPREIKDETKQTQGDPLIKGAIRSRQVAISRNRMLSEVADANVVLVNPTHYAVALSYDPLKGAPRVVAKGVGSLAQKIRDIARDNRVPVVEDKPLTRTLYRICELGDEIPTELYLVVARILAFVMAAGRPGRKAGTQRPPKQGRDVPELPSKAQLRARRAQQTREARAWSHKK
jgi:flagellar biosynthetic protein FlhB